MTAKEKAVELIDKFTFNCRECDNGKLSALIAVDLLQEQLFLTNGKYWEEVKKHIEKL